MITLFSPAKLNLFFRVLRKRSDGYHEIASLYQAIDLGDLVSLILSDRDRISCSDPAIPCDETNLVSRALSRFRERTPCPPVHIHLEKRIPIQAGFGGGSSNAATTLFALNELMGRPVTEEELAAMGATIGSDVAFFFSLGTAYGTGRGEILEEASIASISGYLAKPDFGMSTPAVYRETRLEGLMDPRLALNSFQTKTPLFFNDLEAAAFRIEPKLVEFKKTLLSSGFSTVLMTGSGSAFFCLGHPSFHPPASLFIPFQTLQRTRGSWFNS